MRPDRTDGDGKGDGLDGVCVRPLAKRAAAAADDLAVVLEAGALEAEAGRGVSLFFRQLPNAAANETAFGEAKLVKLANA
jgi:hypothetical protein